MASSSKSKGPNPVAKERQRIGEIGSRDSVRITRALQADRQGETVGNDSDCCFTAIRFKKIYPGDMTVKLTTDDGRNVERKFSASKTVRTAFIKKKGSNDDDDDQSDIVIGGLGRCVDVDVAIADTASAILAITHYHFRLCCDDPRVRNGTRLTHREPPITPHGQITTLPLLEITGVQRSPCP
jgi:hypothetical protein